MVVMVRLLSDLCISPDVVVAVHTHKKREIALSYNAYFGKAKEAWPHLLGPGWYRNVDLRIGTETFLEVSKEPASSSAGERLNCSNPFVFDKLRVVPIGKLQCLVHHFDTPSHRKILPLIDKYK